MLLLLMTGLVGWNVQVWLVYSDFVAYFFRIVGRLWLLFARVEHQDLTCVETVAWVILMTFHVIP